MKFRLAVAATASFALAACGSADDASTEAEADTVEIPANEALEGVDAEPVADDAAAIEAEDQCRSLRGSCGRRGRAHRGSG